MITRKGLEAIIFNRNSPSRADEIMKLLEPYTALVDAAVAWHGSTGSGKMEGAALYRAIQPLIKKPLLSEKLDKLAGDITKVVSSDMLRQLADEARELEQ